MPCSWRAHHPPARPSLPRRTVRRSQTGARHRGANRHPGYDAGGDLGGRGLDPRIPGSMAVAASKVAVAIIVPTSGVAFSAERSHPDTARFDYREMTSPIVSGQYQIGKQLAD